MRASHSEEILTTKHPEQSTALATGVKISFSQQFGSEAALRASRGIQPPLLSKKGEAFRHPLYKFLSTLPSALRASGEFLNCGSQYTVSGRPAY